MRIFKFFAIGLVFVLFFILGINTADLIPNALTTEDTIYVDTIYDIDIRKTNDVIEKNYKLYLDDLNDIPDTLRQNCEEIIFTSENLSKKFELEITSSVAAISYGDTIYINTDNYFNNVLIHEMFHVYDYKNKWISEKEQFNNLYEDYKEYISVSPGNIQNCYEFFASCGEMYFLSPDEMVEKTPLIYEYFDSLNIN